MYTNIHKCTDMYSFFLRQGIRTIVNISVDQLGVYTLSNTALALLTRTLSPILNFGLIFLVILRVNFLSISASLLAVPSLDFTPIVRCLRLLYAVSKSDKISSHL